MYQKQDQVNQKQVGGFNPGQFAIRGTFKITNGIPNSDILIGENLPSLGPSVFTGTLLGAQNSVSCQILQLTMNIKPVINQNFSYALTSFKQAYKFVQTTNSKTVMTIKLRNLGKGSIAKQDGKGIWSKIPDVYLTQKNPENVYPVPSKNLNDTIPLTGTLQVTPENDQTNYSLTLNQVNQFGIFYSLNFINDDVQTGGEATVNGQLLSQPADGEKLNFKMIKRTGEQNFTIILSTLQDEPRVKLTGIQPDFPIIVISTGVWTVAVGNTATKAKGVETANSQKTENTVKIE